MPPLAEQESILAVLDASTKLARIGIRNAVRSIDLVRQYRVRLIADVVTGKVDVREAAAGLRETTVGFDSVDGAELMIDLEEARTDGLDTTLGDVEA